MENAAADPSLVSSPANRRQQLLLLLGFGLGSFAWNLCWPFLPLRIQDVGVRDLGQVAQLSGLLAGGTNLITAAMGPLWILLAERFSYRLQVIRAHLGTGLTMTVLGLARSPLQLVGAAGALGTLGGNYPHYLALVAMRTPPAEMGQMVGDIQAAGQIGGTLGPLLGGVIAGQLGLSAAFVSSSVVSAIALTLAVTLIRPDRPRAEPAAPGKGGALRQAIARPEQRTLMVLYLLGDACLQGLRPLIPIVLSERVPDQATVATLTGLTSTLATGGTVVAALVVGRLSKRLAPRWILSVTLPTAALAAALLPFARALPAMLLLWTLLGLASGATTPAMFAWMGRLATSGRGAYALLATVNMLGFAIGPAAVGEASIVGLDWAFRLAAASALGAAVLIASGQPRAPVAGNASALGD